MSLPNRSSTPVTVLPGPALPYCEIQSGDKPRVRVFLLWAAPETASPGWLTSPAVSAMGHAGETGGWGGGRSGLMTPSLPPRHPCFPALPCEGWVPLMS